jgi:hypothetical protein
MSGMRFGAMASVDMLGFNYPDRRDLALQDYKNEDYFP